jgi:importin subunit beta-1
VLNALTASLAADDVSVADSAIWALDKLVQGYGDLAEQEGADNPAGTPLSPFFAPLVQALLAAAERPDAVKLRLDAYDALCDTLTAACAPEGPLLVQLVPHLLGKLAATWEGAAPLLSAEAVEAQAELQGLLCGVLMVITSRLDKMGGQHKASLTGAPGTPGLADAMMVAYLRVFSCRSATVHGEALLAASALVDALGAESEKYLGALLPVIELGLKNYGEEAVFANTVTLLGDLARALEARLDGADGRVGNSLMSLLLTSLGSNELGKAAKPHIIAVFGDFALALGAPFARFLPHVGPMLAGASAHSCAVVSSARGDETELAANNELRCAILEAYSGIFQGLKLSEEGMAHLAAQAARVADFVSAVYADGTADDGVLKAAVGVLGDLACLDGCAAALAPRADLMMMLRQCLSYPAGSAVREAAEFAERELQARTQAKH